MTPFPVRIWPNQVPPPPLEPSALPGRMAFEMQFWPVLFVLERIPSTHRDPGCVPSPAPPHTTSCIHPRVCSCPQDRGGSALTGCASPGCIQHPHSGPAFPAGQGSPANLPRLGDTNTIVTAQCGHQLALHPISLLQQGVQVCGCHMNY